MNERREIRRQAAQIRGRLVLEHGQPLSGCVVQDVTTVGAGLEVEAHVQLPERFDLLIGEGGAMRACATVWRSGDRAGVCFT